MDFGVGWWEGRELFGFLFLLSAHARSTHFSLSPKLLSADAD